MVKSSVMKHLYRNDYAESDSKISYIIMMIFWPVKYLQ